MKGWVGLVGWPVADGLPTLVVTRQLQVERRTWKVRQSETDILPLCHAESCVGGYAREAGTAAELAASRKEENLEKYANTGSQYLFTPIAVETLGPLNT